MKTTVEISDPLLREAKSLAAERQITLRSLIEEGLRVALERHRARRSFQMRHVTFGGDGLQAEFVDAGWDRIRGAVYEDQSA